MNGNHDIVYSMMQFWKDLKHRHNQEILCSTDKVQLKAKHNVASLERNVRLVYTRTYHSKSPPDTT
jgi:hypothetical protein